MQLKYIAAIVRLFHCYIHIYMRKKKEYWVPVEYQGIQYNTCKNPKCENFGINPYEKPDGYALNYGGKALQLLKCTSCGEVPPLKSNRGIYDEWQRLMAHMEPVAALTCTDEACVNHKVPVGTPKAYRSFGKTASGTQRYRCNACGKTVSQPKANSRQRVSHHNIDIFKMLVNKVPLSRIVEILGISWELLYNRIDFIHKQCMRFAGNRERKLSDMEFERLYISVDKQDHVINWTDRKDKRNVVLSAITSVDNTSGYVFGVHPNFDGGADKAAIAALVAANDDASLPAAHRISARYWTEADYEAVARRAIRRRVGGVDVQDAIQNRYSELSNREDVEAFENKSVEEKLPDYGVQIHAEYTMIGHFYYLKSLLSGARKLRFFLDQESGIRAAVLSVFNEMVKEHRAEAFYVRINKDMTVDEKRQSTGEAKARMRELKRSYPDMDEEAIKLAVLKQAIAEVQSIGQWKDRWVSHPMPDMSEPEKAMCWLTEHETFDEDHVAWLYNKATLHGVDSFFEKVRRRVSLFERAIRSSSSDGRTWNGYSAYNPAMVGKLLDIFRVVHNYVDTRKLKGQEPTTAAMRFGLAKAPIQYKDILYYE